MRSVTTPSSSDIDWPSTGTLSSSLPYNQHQRPLSNGRIPSANASLQHATALLGATGNGARRLRERVETTSSFHPKVVHRLNESTTWIWTFNKKLHQHRIHHLPSLQHRTYLALSKRGTSGSLPATAGSLTCANSTSVAGASYMGRFRDN